MSAGAPAPSMTRAVAWTVGTLTSMLSMALAARELSAELLPHHMAFYRSAICLALLVPIVALSGWHVVATSRIRGHIARNTVHFAAQWCWFFGLGVLPMAAVFAVEFTAPVWGALLAALFLGERLTRTRVVAVTLGFLGILLVLRPGVEIIDPASFVVLGAALGYGAAFVLTRALVQGESALTVVWWMNVVQLPIGALISMDGLPWPSPALLPWAMLLGLAGLGSHFCLSQALRYGDVAVVAPLDFLRLPLGALVAWLIYDEAIDPYLGAGAVLILIGNWINLRKR